MDKSLEEPESPTGYRTSVPTAENVSQGTFWWQLKATVKGRPWTAESAVLGRGPRRGQAGWGPAGQASWREEED